jgi:hypothetical protein
MYETAWLRHKIYMTRIIAQQTAELDHVNIFNIANFLRIYGNSSFGCSLFSSHGYPPRHGLFALAINVSIAACSTLLLSHLPCPERSNAVSSEAM